MKSRTLIRLVTGASSLSLSMLATAAFAQSQTPPEGPAKDDESIIVTGTRIARPEIEFPNPVTSVSAQMIERSGKIDVTSLLVNTPSLVGSLTNGSNAGSNSQNYAGGLPVPAT